MSKIQKIWMWIFIAMFAIPEILWSPVLNFYYGFWQSGRSGNVNTLRNNFLQKADNWNYLKFIILLQLIGLVLFLIQLIRNKKSIKKVKYFSILFVSLVVTFLVATALYLAMAINLRIF